MNTKLMYFIVILLIAVIYGCGGGGGKATPEGKMVETCRLYQIQQQY